MVTRVMTMVALIGGGMMVPGPVSGQSVREARVDQQLPCTIRISPVLQPVVGQLLASSPTFRAQVRRIAAAPHVRVVVEPAIGRAGCCTLARTWFRHFSEGGIRAHVEVAFPASATSYAQLLGHEFEHVLEQIERVDVRRLAREGAGAQEVGDDLFETQRAAQAGLQVADEASAAGIEPRDRVRDGFARAFSAVRRVFRPRPAAEAGGAPAADRQK
jgi:hypothetical protein